MDKDPILEASEYKIEIYMKNIQSIIDNDKLNEVTKSEFKLLKAEFESIKADVKLTVVTLNGARITNIQAEEKVSNGVKTFITALIALVISIVNFHSDKTNANQITMISTMGPLLVAIYFLITGIFVRMSSEREMHYARVRTNEVTDHSISVLKDRLYELSKKNEIVKNVDFNDETAEIVVISDDIDHEIIDELSKPIYNWMNIAHTIRRTKRVTDSQCSRMMQLLADKGRSRLTDLLITRQENLEKKASGGLRERLLPISPPSPNASDKE